MPTAWGTRFFTQAGPQITANFIPGQQIKIWGEAVRKWSKLGQKSPQPLLMELQDSMDFAMRTQVRATGLRNARLMQSAQVVKDHRALPDKVEDDPKKGTTKKKKSFRPVRQKNTAKLSMAGIINEKGGRVRANLIGRINQGTGRGVMWATA